MYAQEIFDTLTAAGITLAPSPNPGRLLVSPREPLTDVYRALIIEHKAELLALLARRAAPPALTPDERADIAESIAERAAIREYEAGETRVQAEHEARSAMRVYQMLVAMPDGSDPRWVTMIAPGCDLAEARRSAALRFGPERVLEVLPHGEPK